MSESERLRDALLVADSGRLEETSWYRADATRNLLYTVAGVLGYRVSTRVEKRDDSTACVHWTRSFPND